jgi:ABC-type transport system involved in multi-copper enzyme maturation permease subunit
MPSLLHYRAWQGVFRGSWWSVWPIARVSLGVLLRRWLFWILYGPFGLLLFLMFFFGTFLLSWAESQLNMVANDGKMAQIVRGVGRALSILNGSQDTYQYFFAYQGSIVIVTLALVGAIVVGNDYTFRCLTFYLAKPIGRWHYILGKCLAVFLIVQMLTTLPALLLYTQHVFDDWSYLTDVHFFAGSTGGPGGIPLLLGVLGYGTILSAFLSVLLVATASWMRRTMPLIMVWMSLFIFMRLLSNILVDNLKLDVHWRLMDLWNNLSLLGQACLGFAHDKVSANAPQPQFWEAGLTLAGVCVVCLIYLNHRTRGVEIVR